MVENPQNIPYLKKLSQFLGKVSLIAFSLTNALIEAKKIPSFS